MFACPHCGAFGISSSSKFHATPANPAVCTLCNAIAAEAKALAVVLPIVWVFAVLVGLEAAILLFHWWPLLAAVGAAVSIEFLVWRFARLLPVSPEQALGSQRSVAIFATSVLVCLIALGLIRSFPWSLL